MFAAEPVSTAVDDGAFDASDAELGRRICAVLRESRVSLSVSDLQGCLLQQGCRVPARRLRALCLALERWGAVRRRPAAFLRFACGDADVGLPDGFDATPQAPRVDWGRVPSVFDLGRAMLDGGARRTAARAAHVAD